MIDQNWNYFLQKKSKQTTYKFALNNRSFNTTTFH